MKNIKTKYPLEKIKFIDILDVGEELKKKVLLWRNKERVRKCMINQDIISEEEHRKWLKQLRNSITQKFWITFFEDTPFGIVNLNNIDSANLISEWGFYIGEEKFLGKGMGRKMLCKLLMFYFDIMKYNKLITKVLSGNEIALRLYGQFGFHQIGTEKYSENKDIVIFDFSAQDWDKYKKELMNACN
jgi:UDP-4-amino-4,6-dideoxy-N-acetyl-beta-L-altrosamine N-acetyltransferase